MHGCDPEKKKPLLKSNSIVLCKKDHNKGAIVKHPGDLIFFYLINLMVCFFIFSTDLKEKITTFLLAPSSELPLS